MDRKGNHSVEGAELIFAFRGRGTHSHQFSVCVCVGIVWVCFICFHMCCASDFVCTVGVFSDGYDA